MVNKVKNFLSFFKIKLFSAFCNYKNPFIFLTSKKFDNFGLNL